MLTFTPEKSLLCPDFNKPLILYPLPMGKMMSLITQEGALVSASWGVGGGVGVGRWGVGVGYGDGTINLQASP